MIRINKYVAGLRGFWTGFERSFYADSRRMVSNRCFSSNLVKDLFFVVNFIEGKESFTKVISFVTTSARILNDNMNYCGYKEAVADIETFCLTANCQPRQLIKNVSNNIFKMLGDLQGIAAVLYQFPPNNKEDMYLASMSIGMDCGKFVRTIFNFTFR